LPVSSTTHLTGIVEWAANGPVLRTDGGGTWELDNTRQVRKFIGARVEVVGERRGSTALPATRYGLPDSLDRLSSNSASNSSLPQPSSPMAYMRRLAGSSAYCADAERLGALGLR